MSRIKFLPNGDFTLKPRKDINTLGRVLLVIGAVALVGYMVSVFLFNGFLSNGLFIFCISFLILGGIFSFVGSPILFDVTKKQIQQKTHTWNFDEFGALMLGSYVQRVYTQYSTTINQRFKLGLVQTAKCPQIVNQLAKFDHQIRGIVAKKVKKVDTRLLTKLRTTIGQSSPGLNEAIFTVLDSANELEIVQIAETLSKQLDIPIMDLTASDLVVHNPSTIELPLVDKLRQKLVTPAKSESTPKGASKLASEAKLTLEFKKPRKLPPAVLWPLMMLGFAVSTYFFFTESVGGGLMAFGVTIVSLLFFGLRDIGTQDFVVEVDQDFVKLGSKGQASPIQLQLGSIRSIKNSTILGEKVVFVMEDRIHNLVMPASLGKWIRYSIEDYLS